MNSKPDNTPKRSLLLRLFYWLFNWRMVRRAAIALACFVTLIALLYTEEDWRGKRAWEQCKRELQSKGVVTDWSAFIPPPVPDDQNFFKAPGIQESDWIGRGLSDLAQRVSRVSNSIFDDRTKDSLLIAEVTVAPGDSPGSLRIGDSNAPAEARKMLEQITGPTSEAAQGFTLVARISNPVNPAKIVVSASHAPSTNDLASLFSDYLPYDPPGQGSIQSHVRIEHFGDNSFRVTLAPAPEPAGGYLHRFESFQSAFNAIRAASERPCARMDGDYSQPTYVPIPNFQTLRIVSQTLANHAKCHLLLGDPDQAVRDLSLIHGFYHVLQAKPTGQPMTLVAAMINIAIVGLHADTIADGFRMRAWQEPQLLALQQQLAEIDLLPVLTSSLVSEKACSFATLDQTRPFELFKALQSIQGQKATWLGMMSDPLCRFLALAPRGWIYQNMVFGFKIRSMADIADASNGLIMPDVAARETEFLDSRPKWSPYCYLSSLYIPNFTKAWQRCALTQTRVHQALVACALERYRLAHGNYPESLDSLAPQFIEKIPHDLIGGQPLHYRCGKNGTFLLYSIGWNQKDDGGQVVQNEHENPSVEAGDWVWQPDLR